MRSRRAKCVSVMMYFKMGISRNPRKADARPERIGHRGLGVEVRIVGFVALRRIGEFAHHSESCTGSAQWHSAPDRVVQGGLHRGAHPKVDVVGLIAAGNKNRAGMSDCIADERIDRGFSIGDDERRNRIEMANASDVGVVFVGLRLRAESENLRRLARLQRNLNATSRSVPPPISANPGRDCALIFAGIPLPAYTCRQLL